MGGGGTRGASYRGCVVDMPYNYDHRLYTGFDTWMRVLLVSL